MVLPLPLHTIAWVGSPMMAFAPSSALLARARFRILSFRDAQGLWAAPGGLDSCGAVLLALSGPTDDAAASLPLLACDRARPVLILLGEGTAHERAALLDAGAADVLACPFHPIELLARLRARLRERGAAIDTGAEPLMAAGCRLDPSARMAESPDGRRLCLTGAEFDLLRALGSRPGRIWTRAALRAEIDPLGAAGGDRSIDVLIGRLRRKLGDAADRPRFIETVRGLGYRLLPDRPRRGLPAAAD